jgi:hypothetical protein
MGGDRAGRVTEEITSRLPIWSGLARVRTARDGNASSILGYLARVAALARFGFESVGPIQSLSVAAHSLGREKQGLNEIGAASYRSNV